MLIKPKKVIYKAIWKPIKGYEGLYEVSNLGQVRSVDRCVDFSNGKKCFYKRRMLKQFNDKTRYKNVGLHKNNKRKIFKIHRLVAQAFIPNPYNKPEVDHIDTCKENNRIFNLSWCTRSENNNNILTRKHRSESMIGHEVEEKTRIKMSEALKGRTITEEARQKMRDNHANFKDSKHPRAKKVYCVELDKYWDCIKECSNELQISRDCISMCCRGVHKSAGGLHFKYA